MLWAIGDLQGCLDPLRALLAQIPATDRLLFVGDLVNRGPQSLATLRFVRDLGDRAIALLGNHDLHLLAVDAGIRGAHDDDTLQDILDAPDRTDLIDWLRHRPLAHGEDAALFIHAGVLPEWTVDQTLSLAAEVQAGLRDARWRAFLAQMYGNQPDRWRDDLQGADRTRCVINALTRLRFVDSDGAMQLKLKEGVDRAPPGVMPWFEHPARRSRDHMIIFGHWSALGWTDRNQVICLDTGCVWGGCLTALSWPNRQRLQLPCPQVRAPG